MDSILERVANFVPLILLSEIGSLLHDLGKLSQDFVMEHILSRKSRGFQHNLILRRLTLGLDPLLDLNPDSETAKKYISNPEDKLFEKCESQKKQESQIPEDFILGKEAGEKNLELIKFLSCYFSEELKLPWHVDDIFQAKSLGDFLEMHHGSCWRPGEISPWLLWPTWVCDILNSSVDKSSVGNLREAMQDIPCFASTPFGYEGQKIDIDNLDNERHNFAQILYTELEELLSKISSTSEKLNAIRNFRRKILKTSEKSFWATLADTRRAVNDSRLWDHVYSVASMSKALIVKYLIEWPEGAEKPPPTYLPLRKAANWRILSLVFDGVGFITRGHKIGDILGRISVIEELKGEVKELLEEIVPMGNEIYRDEYGIHFLIPAIDDENIKCRFHQELEQKVLNICASKDKYSDIYPRVLISQKPTKTLTTLGQQIKDARKYLQEPIVSSGASWCQGWNSLPGRAESHQYVQDLQGYLNNFITCEDVCYSHNPNLKARCEYGDPSSKVYCASIYSHEKDVKKAFTPEIEICPVCRLRPKCEQQELCKTCYKNRDERVKPWLNGIREISPTIWIGEVADSSAKVALILGHIDLSHWLDGTFVPTLLSQSLDWGITKENIDKAQKDLLDMDHDIRMKYPSATRLRNLWRTTEIFWQDSLNDIKTILDGRLRDQSLRGRRIWLSVDWEQRPPARLAYNAKVGNVEFEVYWHSSDKLQGLAITENLENLAAQFGVNDFNGLYDKLFGEELILTDNSRYRGMPLRITGTISDVQIQSDWCKTEDKGRDYLPFITILSSPVTFMVVVPAAEARQMVDKIKARFDNEFGKVKAHLPVHLSVLYFHKHYPLYIAMDAAKRMLEMPEPSFEDWTISNFDKENGKIKIEFDNGCFWEVNPEFGDGKLDSCHTYVFVNDERAKDKPTYFGNLSSVFPDVPAITISDLEGLERAKIKVMPGYFDYEYLDSIGRRFELSYQKTEEGLNRRRHRNIHHGPRPYYMDIYPRFSRIWDSLQFGDGDRKTRLKNLESMLASAHNLWTQINNQEDRDGLRKHIENTFINVGKKAWWNNLSQLEKEWLIKAALDSTIFDLFELRLVMEKGLS